MRKLFFFILLIAPCNLYADVTEFISGEVGPNNSTNRDAAELLPNPWRAQAEALGACDTSYQVGDLEGLVPFPHPDSTGTVNNTIQFTVSGVGVMISNRDMNNIFGTTFNDRIGDPGGVVSLSNSLSLIHI